jgi:hypothetical protein
MQGIRQFNTNYGKQIYKEIRLIHYPAMDNSFTQNY